MPNDYDLCESVCQTASRLGYKLEQLKSHIGWSYNFRNPDGSYCAVGTIQKDRDTALINACKEMLPKIVSEM